MGRIYDATWGRAFSAIYDRAMKSTEEAGMREIRRQALSRARGRTVDIGAGTGINVELYPAEVTELVLAEPDEHMLKRLRPKLGGTGRRAEAVQAPAERLPFEDDSFDTAVFTLVLCTVPDPPAALAEAARVLRPGGRLLFVEHVRSPEARPGPVAGSPRAPLEVPRRRLSLQSRHSRDDRSLTVRRRAGRARRAAEGASAGQAARARQRRRRPLKHRLAGADGWAMSNRAHRRGVLAALLLWGLLLGLGGCGQEAPGEAADVTREGARSPAEAVERFAEAAGKGSDRRQLGVACRFISPTVRIGFPAQQGRYSEERCARILPLYLFYGAENSDLPSPRGFTAKIVGTDVEGRRAFVETAVDYEGTPDPRKPVTVLAVRESGRWWVAMPGVFNPDYPSLFDPNASGESRATLLSLYEQELTESRRARRERSAAERAK